MDTKFTVEEITDKYREEFEKNSASSYKSNPEIIIKPSGCVLPSHFLNYLERIQNFEVFPDDTWIVTFPKCGTTWTQEMVWLLKNDLDFEKAKNIHLQSRVPFLELEAILLNNQGQGKFSSTIEAAENLTRPRCIKSHLPLELLPRQIWVVKPKLVYVVRDPRDVVISFYHHKRLWTGYQGTLDMFIDAFLHDRVVYAPFWSHVLGFLNVEDKSHILVNTFEEMKKDLEQVIKKTASFLKVDLTNEQIVTLMDHLSFKNMQKNESVNYEDASIELRKNINNNGKDEHLIFMRKGESGQWKNTLGPDILDQFKQWTQFHLKGTDLFNEYLSSWDTF